MKTHRFAHALLWFGQLVLLILIVLLRSEIAPPRDTEPQPHQPQQYTTTATPPPSSQNVHHATDETEPPAAEKGEKFREFLDKAQTDPIVLLTLALFVVGAVQAATYIATFQSNKAVQRAFIAPVFRSATYQDPRLNFEIAIDLKNTGTTPAHDVVFRADIDVVPFPIPVDFPYHLPPATGIPMASFLAPGATKFIVPMLRTRIPEADVPRVKRLDGSCLLAWGIVTYRDVFERDHTMKFALIARWIDRVGTGADGHPLPAIVTTSDAPRHNETD